MIINIEIFGIGGEVVAGYTSKFESKLNEAFDETKMSLEDIMNDDDIRTQFEIPEWCEIDNLLHMYGPFLHNNDDCILKVSVNDNELIKGRISELENNDGDQILELEECYLETKDNQIFTAVNSEKGCVFSGYLNIPDDEEFFIDRLKLYSKELMINEEYIALCIYKVQYKEDEVSNADFSTLGVGLDIQLHS